MAKKRYKKKRPIPKFMIKEQVRQQQQRKAKMAQDMQKMNKEIGRDGAYMEIDAKDLFEEMKKEETPKMMVLKASRFDLSDPKYIEGLKGIFQDIGEEEIEGMEPDQVSFYVLRKIMEAGIMASSQKTCAQLGTKG